MTPRDLWEVITFQVSWVDSNIFIVLLAIAILTTFTIIIWQVFSDWWQSVKYEFSKDLEAWRNFTPEERWHYRKKALKRFFWVTILTPSFFIFLYYLANSFS